MRTPRETIFRHSLGILGLIASALACAGCSGDPEGLTVTVVDGATGAAIPGALVAVEEGGIYLANADLTKGNPSYKGGGQADGSGVISLPYTTGELGLHVFANGYRYGPKRAFPEDAAEVTIELAAHLAEDVRPVVGDITLDPATVAPGGMFTARVTVAAGMVTDPALEPIAKLSEEVLLVAPAIGISKALDPPAPGCSIGTDPANPRGCPDGEYTSTFAAPDAAGTYTYSLVVSSEGCVTSDRRDVTLTVQ